MQNKEFQLVYQNKTQVLGKDVVWIAYIKYENGVVRLSGNVTDAMGYHEAYPPQTVDCAREILEDAGFTEIDPLENLRAFIRTGPFQVTKIEQALEVSRGVVSHFLNSTYQDKQGNVLKSGLGAHEDKVFEYMRQYGYKDDVAYEQFL